MPGEHRESKKAQLALALAQGAVCTGMGSDQPGARPGGQTYPQF